MLTGGGVSERDMLCSAVSELLANKATALRLLPMLMNAETQVWKMLFKRGKRENRFF